MPTLTRVRASNARLKTSNLPRTVVFVGATDGIGKAALTELVLLGCPLRIYVVGRNAAIHEPQMAHLRALNSMVEIIYLEGQCSLMTESKRLANEIATREQEIDALFLSAGFVPFTGRQETEEGLELATAVAYYSRMIFISRLLPQLRAASQNESNPYSPRIINILVAGEESGDIYAEDLSLKEPGRFNIPNFRRHVATMTATAMKRLAETPENQNLVFLNAHPGWVATDLVKKSWGDEWDEQSTSGVGPQREMVLSTPKESGERSLYLMTSTEYGGKSITSLKQGAENPTVPTGRIGSLVSVGDALEILELDTIFADLQSSGAADVIWEDLRKQVGSYLL